MTTVDAEHIRRAHTRIAVAAGGRNLKSALRAEVVFVLHPRAADGAKRDKRLPEQEVKHRADAAWQDEADDHPQTRAHGASWTIAADVTDHEHVERA